MRVWAVVLLSVALVAGAVDSGWAALVGASVAGAVVGALVGTVWAEETGRPVGLQGAALGSAGAVLLVGLPAGALAVLVLTSAAMWTPWRRARRSGSSPWPRRPATR